MTPSNPVQTPATIPANDPGHGCTLPYGEQHTMDGVAHPPNHAAVPTRDSTPYPTKLVGIPRLSRLFSPQSELFRRLQRDPRGMSPHDQADSRAAPLTSVSLTSGYLSRIGRGTQALRLQFELERTPKPGHVKRRPWIWGYPSRPICSTFFNREELVWLLRSLVSIRWLVVES